MGTVVMIAGDQRCRCGSQNGGGRGIADVATRLVDVDNDGGMVLTWKLKEGEQMTMGSSVMWHIVRLQIDDQVVLESTVWLFDVPGH